MGDDRASVTDPGAGPSDGETGWSTSRDGSTAVSLDELDDAFDTERVLSSHEPIRFDGGSDRSDDSSATSEPITFEETGQTRSPPSDSSVDPTRVDELEARIESLETDVRRLSEAVRTLDEEFGGLSSSIDEIQSDLDVLVSLSKTSLGSGADAGSSDEAAADPAEDAAADPGGDETDGARSADEVESDRSATETDGARSADEEESDPSAGSEEAPTNTGGRSGQERTDGGTVQTGPSMPSSPTTAGSDAGTVDTPDGSGTFQFEKVVLPANDEPLPTLSGEDVQRPYLESLPTGYRTETVAIQWLDDLIDRGNGEAAAAVIVDYEDAGWLSAAVAEALLTYLDGLVESDVDTELGASAPPRPAAYDLDDHLRSLAYVSELAADPELSVLDVEVIEDGL